ncbi:MAG: TetR family transcriptional regulator [Acetobacteraceae bacterium]|nr:TetR family transcriptional regulator [Acetobacteraceae bacterium]
MASAALVGLIGVGTLALSAELVAERASVGLRSVFRHFSDMDSLYREMHANLAAKMATLAQQPFRATTRDGKILELVDRRAVAFERLAPFLRAAQLHRHQSADLQARHCHFIQRLRQPMIDLLVVGSDGIAAIDLLLGFEAWQHLRTDQGLDPAAARQVLQRIIAAVLPNSPGHGGAGQSVGV